MTPKLNELHKHFKADQGLESIIREVMDKRNNKDYAEFLYERGVITRDERDRTIQMIDSSNEDYEIAKIFLANKTAELSKQSYNT